MCAICTSDHRFTYTLSGWPNSVHDSRVWSSSQISHQPSSFFSKGEYLLADSAYSSTLYVISPYKKPTSLSNNSQHFNRILSSIRIDIEHAFGMLKGRWKSLCGLRLKVDTDEHYEYAIQWIIACVVLHNVLLDV